METSESKYSIVCDLIASRKVVDGNFRQVTPNPLLNRTRYGSRRKPGVRRLRHLRTPGLRRPPQQAG